MKLKKTLVVILAVSLLITMSFTGFAAAEDDPGYGCKTVTMSNVDRGNTLKTINYYVQTNGKIKVVLNFDTSLYTSQDLEGGSFDIVIKNKTQNNSYWSSACGGGIPSKWTLADSTAVNPGDVLSVKMSPCTDSQGDYPCQGTDTAVEITVPQLSAFEKVVPALTEKTYTLSPKTSKKVEFSLKSKGYVKFDSSNTQNFFDVKIYDMSTEELVYDKTLNASDKPEYTGELDAGSYRLEMENTWTSWTVSTTVSPVASNTNKTVATAKTLTVPLGTATKATATEVNDVKDGQGGKLIYKFKVSDYAYYQVKLASDDKCGKVRLCTASQVESALTDDGIHTVLWSNSPSYDYGEVVMKPGTYYLVASAGKGERIHFTMYCRDYTDIKTLTGPSKVTMTLGEKKLVKLTAGPAAYPIGTVLEGGTDYSKTGYESKITWGCSSAKMVLSSYTWDFAQYLKPSKVGRYTVTATTSEGIKKSFTVDVAPKKMSTSAISSSGTTKSTTIKWDNPGDFSGTNYYILYKKVGSSYKQIYAGSKTAKTVTGLSPNKTYSFKLQACYKTSSGAILKGGMSNEFKAVTAPSKAPKITYAKCTSNKYYKKSSRYVAGHWNANYTEWFPGYTVVTPAHSVVSVKVKFSSVSGASSYEYLQTSGTNALTDSKAIKSGGTMQYGFSGKKTGSIYVKVRAIKKNSTYNSVAIGPWSSNKTVKVK